MNMLTLEDLLEVSMFKCKICRRRLQCPVLQVGMYGNICGICHESSAFTNVIPNEDVETLLGKLQVPCYYKERGCTYDGSYYKTCVHERVCEFRDKICPFAYVRMCDNVTRDCEAFPAHIRSYHEEYVLMGDVNSPMAIPNPTETKPDLVYLLDLKDKMLLMRTWIDSKEECIFYALYYFKSHVDLRDIKISFNVMLQNTLFNITGVDIHVQPESAIGAAYDNNDVIKIPVAILKALNSLERVEISINVKQQPVEALKASSIFQSGSLWMRCPQCSKVEDRGYKCARCCMRACYDCFRIMRKGCQRLATIEHKWNQVALSEWILVGDSLCENSGCCEILKPYAYDDHKEACLFKKHACPLQKEVSCNWRGLVQNMADHIKDKHPKLLNKNNWSLRTSKVIYFFKDNNIFKQELNLSSNGDLSIKTSKVTAPAWDNSYKWEVRLKRKDKLMMMVITDLCTEEGHQKTVNVKNYVNGDGLDLYADINSVSESVNSSKKRKIVE